MAESELKIKLSVDGDATLGQVKTRIKEINKELLGLPLASERTKVLRQEMLGLKSAMDQAAGGTGQMMRNYFQLGEVLRADAAQRKGLVGLIKEERQEQRMVNFAMREGINAMEAFGGQSKAFAGAITGTADSFSGVQFAVKSLGGTLAQYATLVAGVMGAMTLWSEANKSVDATIVSLNKTMQENYDLLYKLGKLTDEQYAKKLKAEEERIKRSKDKSGGFSLDLLWKYMSGELTLGKGGGGAVLALEALDREKQKENELLKIEEKRESVTAKIAENLGGFTPIEGLPSSLRRGKVPGVSSIKGAPEQGAPPGMEDSGMFGAFQAFGGFQATVMSGLDTMSLGIEQKIGGALLKVFGGEANSIFEQFLQGFSSMLLQIVSRLAVLQIFSWLFPGAGGIMNIAKSFDKGGWIREPVAGVGLRSGGLYTIAERKPEYVSTANDMAQRARGGGGVQIIPIAKADGLYALVRYGKQMRSGRAF